MNIISKIDELYKRLPEVGCTGCGQCCVSPTSTMSEFIYLFHYLEKNFTDEAIINFLKQTVKIHSDYEGNSHCPFLKEKRCQIHPGRAGACRLFGIPSLKELGIQDLEECKYNIAVVSGRGDRQFIESWLDDLFSFESSLYEFGSEPYFVKGFNIHSWFDIIFDDSIDFDVFKTIKEIISENINIYRFKEHYNLSTNIREKIDKIGILNTMIGVADAPTLKKLLLSIRDDYPFTGTYFYEEAQAYLAAIEANT